MAFAAMGVEGAVQEIVQARRFFPGLLDAAVAAQNGL